MKAPKSSAKQRQLVFLKDRSGEIGSDMSIGERLKRRQAQALSVKIALEKRNADMRMPRPLKRFGCPLAVMLLNHAGDAGRPRLQRKIVVMLDTLKWNAFPTWLETCLGLEKGAAKSKVVQYFNQSGRAERIASMGQWQSWLDQLWHIHPPELHVYNVRQREGDTHSPAFAANRLPRRALGTRGGRGERTHRRVRVSLRARARARAHAMRPRPRRVQVASIVHEAEDRMSLISDIFAQHDSDGSGTMSVAELRDMLLQLDVATELGLSRDELGAFVALELARADLDDSGELTFDEFVE
jgi:hypothetical protein